MAAGRIRLSASAGRESDNAPPPRDLAYSLRDRLHALGQLLQQGVKQRPQWEAIRQAPPLFFFDRDRQDELLASGRSSDHRLASDPIWHGLASALAGLWPSLIRDLPTRQLARAIPNFREYALQLSDLHPAASQLARLLQVVDEEVLCLIAWPQRVGLSVEVRGLQRLDQVYEILTSDFARGAGLGENFRLFSPRALQRSGMLPAEAHGCVDWLFADQPGADLPRIAGERAVLVRETSWPVVRDAERCFPELAFEWRLVRWLGADEVARRLACWGKSADGGRPTSASLQAQAA